MIYLYALAEGLAELPSLAGVGGSRIGRRAVDGVDLVVSDCASAAVEPTDETVLAHAQVVEAVESRSAAILPARFGRAFADEQALADAIRDQLPVIRDALARVRGCAELGVRVLADDEEPPREAASGAAYMRARLARTVERQRLAAELHGPLAARSRASTHVVDATPRLLLSAAYLVERGRIDDFRTAVTDLIGAHPTLTVACTGPWPPYSFGPASSE